MKLAPSCHAGSRIGHIMHVCIALGLAFPALAPAQSLSAQLSSSGSIMAPSSDPLSVVLSARKVVSSGGKETLADAGHARAGDIIEYRALYRNVSKSPLNGVVATLPLPNTTAYVVDSSRPAKATASTDVNGVYAPLPLMRPAAAALGETRQTAVPLSEYRALRWDLGVLKPGESREVSARVRVMGRHDMALSGAVSGAAQK